MIRERWPMRWDFGEAGLWRLARHALLLSSMLLMSVVCVPAQSAQFKIGGTGSALATMQLLADAYTAEHPGTRIKVLPSLGSGGGIKALLSGAIQVAVSARPLKDKESKAGANSVPLSRTPIVFATQSRNQATGISEQELVDMLAGKTPEWPDGTRVRLILRPVDDSDSRMIKNISSAVRDAKIAAEQRKGMAFAVTDQDAADSIEKIPGSLGVSTLAQIISEQRAIKALRWNDVEPGATTLADGSYPLQKHYVIVTTRKTPAEARDFVAFLESASARAILAANGQLVD